jgi:hypothetical protein
MRPHLAVAAFLLLAHAAAVAAAGRLTVLSVGKVAMFRNGGGTVRVGRDPALAAGPSPACPTTSTVEVSSYPVATQRVAVTARVDLDCSGAGEQACAACHAR